MGATRDRIMDESLRLFASRGFDGTAVTDIEDAAGLAPGSGGFYRHFRSKEAVLAAVVERVVAEIKETSSAESVDVTEGFAAAATPSGPEPTTDELAAAIGRGLERLEERALWIALLARIHGQFPELEAAVTSALMADSVVGAAVALARFGSDPASQATAAVMASAMVGYHLSQDMFGRQPGGVDQEAFAAALAELVIRSGDLLAG